MIVKEVVDKKHQGQSSKNKKSAKKLINYMLDTEHDGEKVDYFQVTNCLSDDVDLAMMEISISQENNTRTTLDKTMHLVISFSVGEIPSREQLNDIEQTIADAAGLGTHQRISVAHTNTENYHLHLSINKIDPETGNIVNPRYYLRDIAKARGSLEIKHGLQRLAGEKENQNPSHSMEYHAGEQSLETWCREHIKTPLEDAISSVGDWQDIHAVFQDAGLSLRKAGRGLVVQDKSSHVSVKASAVSRQLSLTRLEKNLGAFRPGREPKTPVKEPTSAYTAEKKADPLYQQYLAFREERQLAKTDALARLRHTVAQQRLLARTDNQIKRQKLRASVQSPTQKRNIYLRLAENNRQHLKVITAGFADARKKVYADYGNMTYQQYLCLMAANGNEEALARLRRTAQATIKHQGLSGDGDKRITQFDAVRVDKHGVIAYQVGQHAILDNGKALTCKDDSLMADRQLLEMAVAKYGRHLTLNGSEAFKARILSAAEQLNMDVVLNGQTVGENDPVQQFIANRNHDRVNNRKIMYHERFAGQEGEFTYQGYRNVGQQPVVLLRQGYTVYVKPVTRQEQAKYRQHKMGARIDTSPRQKANDNDRGAEYD